MISSSDDTKFRDPFSNEEDIQPPPVDDGDTRKRRNSTLNQSKADIPSASTTNRPRRNSQLRTSQGVPIEGAEVNSAIEEDTAVEPDVSEVGKPRIGSGGPHRGSLVGSEVRDSNDWATGAFTRK
ncbi:hypothetical protein E3Q22_01613 [Wallemia mellicola]|uniref:Uncharacterized protein n=1 Tax=Wallemia mellicola TaxID=1708541 RepID=A0A4T0T372_9BASI|nr:hypothetical protein E3Q22_01613 [Wallemia mellicola]TIC15521.1 hypothetical protein E3Q15_01428 [Wallemia mellicola]TIC56037.1 hypothetical protein E3Q05_01915 [Wallemia mellicola]